MTGGSRLSGMSTAGCHGGGEGAIGVLGGGGGQPAKTARTSPLVSVAGGAAVGGAGVVVGAGGGGVIVVVVLDAGVVVSVTGAASVVPVALAGVSATWPGVVPSVAMATTPSVARTATAAKRIRPNPPSHRTSPCFHMDESRLRPATPRRSDAHGESVLPASCSAIPGSVAKQLRSMTSDGRCSASTPVSPSSPSGSGRSAPRPKGVPSAGTRSGEALEGGHVTEWGRVAASSRSYVSTVPQLPEVTF